MNFKEMLIVRNDADKKRTNNIIKWSLILAVIVGTIIGTKLATYVNSNTKSVICNHEVKLSGKGRLSQNGTIYKLDGKSYNMKDGELCWIEEEK